VTRDAQALLEFMSAISEEAYAASWMDGLEYDLWSALQGGPRRYGKILLHDGLIERLQVLSNSCGGWIRVDDTRGEVFVPLPQWLPLYEAKRPA